MRSHGLDRALSTIGDRWSLLVVAALMRGDLRYGELAEELGDAGDGPGIAPNVLAARLRMLESAMLINAEPYQEKPRRFRYSLTADGRKLAAVLGSLEAWGAREVHPEAHQVHSVCGTALEWRTWCPKCESVGEPPGTDSAEVAGRGGGASLGATPRQVWV
jgi:DNA-binding HxlR family transcriptional regulator